jgi:predicted ribosomally synthesized peptide with nif11-like leader
MSMQAVQAFVAKLQQDEPFRKQVQAVMAAAQQRTTAELLKVAAGAGFAFTEAELTAAVQEQLKNSTPPANSRTRISSRSQGGSRLMEPSGPAAACLVASPRASVEGGAKEGICLEISCCQRGRTTVQPNRIARVFSWPIPSWR